MSVDTLNTDLATLREELTRFLVPRRGGKYPKREYLDALARVEAELSRLREEREGAVEAMNGTSDSRNDWKRWATEQRDRADALSARCARLQQALPWIDHAIGYASTAENEQWGDRLIEVLTKAREALAGPDTPANDWHALSPLDGEDTPADRTAAPGLPGTSTQSEGFPEGNDGDTGAAVTPADSHSTLLGREISGTDQCFPKRADSQEDKT